MAIKHLTREVLVQLLRGERPPQSLLQEFVEHHLEVCPLCRVECEDLERENPCSHELAAAIAVALTRASQLIVDLPKLESEAEQELRELLRLEAAARRVKVNRALSRFRNPILVEKLLEESRKALRLDAYEAYGLAECAQDVALRIPASQFGAGWAMTCVARTNAYRGNALRAVGDFKGAEQLLQFALHFFAEEGNGDPLVEAELLSVFATLRREQGRFEEAAVHFDHALKLYEGCGAEDQTPSVLVSKAIVLSDAGETGEAIAAVEQALCRIDPEREPRLYLAAQHEHALLLVEAGEAEAARALLEENLPLYQRSPDPWTQLRLRWLAGKIARGLGETHEAEQAFAHVRTEFLARGLGFEAALAGLDLSLLYLSLGQAARVRELAVEMVPIFLAQDIQREATAALLLFQEAAHREAATVSMVKEIVAYMKRVRRRPTEAPS